MKKLLLLLLLFSIELQGQVTTGPASFGIPAADGPQGDVWNRTITARYGAQMSSLSNEWVTSIQGMMTPTQATQPYEKIGLLGWIYNSDPSDYSKNITKDGVFIDGRCYVTTGNMTGRCWAAYFEAGTLPGSDGMTVGIELAGNNRSVDQPYVGQFNSKVLLALVAGENGATLPISGFARMMPGSQAAHSGFIGETAAFLDPVNNPVFGVQSNSSGNYVAGIFADGSVRGRHNIQLINTPGLDSKLLPSMNPGETFIWGDTSTGVSYIAYYDGVGYTLWKRTTYIH